MSLILAAGNPIEHVMDKALITTSDGTQIITMNMLTMALIAVLLVITLKFAADAIATGPESQGNDRYLTKGRFAQMIEVLVLAMRDHIIKPQLGEDTNKFLPYLLTLFFFLLYNNVLGLVPVLDLQYALSIKNTPIGGTATSNIAVTAALALIAFFVIHISALKKIGFKAWLQHFTGGAPPMIWPIMIPVEILGTFIKPGALAIRLFANMTAGHTLLATIMMFTGMSLAGVGVLWGSPIVVLSIIAATALMFLELFVAFLQAFIFMFLTVVFIAQFLHHEHDDHAHAEDYHGGHSAENDPAVPVTA